jgi:hypothetical protein
MRHWLFFETLTAVPFALRTFFFGNNMDDLDVVRARWLDVR